MTRWVRLAGPDLHPVAAAARLRGLPHRFLLHSGSDVDGVGRWSFAGFGERIISGRMRGGVCAIDGALVDPFRALDVPDEAADPSGPVPLAVGWLGYDLGRAVEKLAARDPGPEDPPDLWFVLPEAIWRHDARTGHGEIVGRDAGACAVLAGALAREQHPAAAPILGELAADRPAAEHLAAVERALAYLAAGDIFQVNLARRLSAPIRRPGDPLALYAALDRHAPAPFGALVETPETTLLSGSPELFLRRAAGSHRVETRPIKGTRARNVDPAALAGDAKEQAEHLMIVDLLRNDLGRVAALGTVSVDDFARVVTLPTVHHLVSTVSAVLRPDASVADLLRATFPGGSITGAPKVRAMQIIDELEPVRRGPYTGAVGYLGAGGEIDLAIIIRSTVVAREAVSLHVGGGIVIDSTPARELEETEEKAAAWRHALTG